MASADDYAAWIVKNADKKGTPEFDTVAAAYKQAKSESTQVEAQTKEPGFLDNAVAAAKDVPRQFGLTARYGLEGVGNMADFLSAPIRAGLNMVTPKQQNLTGVITGAPAQDMFQSGSGSRLADMLGLPKPQGNLENFVGDVSRSMAMGAVPLSMASTAAKATSGTANRVATLLASHPASQIGSAAASGAVDNLADQAGVGKTGREVLSMGAGMAAPMIPNAARYVADVGRSAVRPFTTNGQRQIAEDVVRKFAEGGPTQINDGILVPGSSPTLAESTGNAGIARLQNSARDVNPNAFRNREVANSNARNAEFDTVAGDQGQLDFYRSQRQQAGRDLYEPAMAVDASQNMTPYIKGQITQLLKRPSIDDASRRAQVLAMERGEKPAPQGSLRALQDIKTMIDDDISEAVRAGKGGQAQALQNTQSQLLNVMERLSPGLAEARQTYAQMSQPINQMEALQGLRLTDGQGNITLAKINNAIDGLERQRNLPGVNNAKSVTADQLNTLQAIREDLLRQSNLGNGKAIGSNTFQNIATNNIISTALPGSLGQMATNKLGHITGQVGKLLYSGPNEAIRNRLVDMMLNPQEARGALTPRAAPTRNSLMFSPTVGYSNISNEQ